MIMFISYRKVSAVFQDFPLFPRHMSAESSQDNDSKDSLGQKISYLTSHCLLKSSAEC